MKHELTHAKLQQFTGDEDRYSHGLNRHIRYTIGVLYLAETGQAYWLIDAIASYLGQATMREALARDPRLETLQFWRLDVNEDRSAVLSVRADSNEEPAISQRIAFTDFPLDHVDIWAGCDGDHWTLYLPSEH